jgi:hypothetical protein
MRTVASLAAAASLAVAASGAIECGCSGTCSAFGDPHIIDFHGHSWLETKLPSFTLYQQGDFAVIADTFSANWIHKVTFGQKSHNQSVTLDVCKSNYQEAASWTHEFNADKAAGVGKAKLDVTVTCRVPIDGPKHKRPPFVLNVELKKRNNDPSGTEMTFLESEAALHSTGACVGGKGSSRLLVAAKPGPKPQVSTCGCSAICSLRGDPHLSSFYGYEGLVSNPRSLAINLYKDGALSIDAGLFDTWYIRNLTVGHHEAYSTKSCKKVGQTFPTITVPALGGSVTVDVVCKLPGKRSLRKLGFHLDVTLAKYDSGKGAFPDQERTIGASGLCTHIKK